MRKYFKTLFAASIFIVAAGGQAIGIGTCLNASYQSIDCENGMVGPGGTVCNGNISCLNACQNGGQYWTEPNACCQYNECVSGVYAEPCVSCSGTIGSANCNGSRTCEAVCVAAGKCWNSSSRTCESCGGGNIDPVCASCPEGQKSWRSCTVIYGASSTEVYAVHAGCYDGQCYFESDYPYQYRCAAGYYGNPTNCQSGGCLPCSGLAGNVPTGNATSPTGATSLTQCYIPANSGPYSDGFGTFKVSSQCNAS